MLSGRGWRTPFLLVPLALFSCGGSLRLYGVWYAHHADRVLDGIMRAEAAGKPDPRVVGGDLLLLGDDDRRLLAKGIRSGTCVRDSRGETVGSQDRGFHCPDARSVLVSMREGPVGRWRVEVFVSQRHTMAVPPHGASPAVRVPDPVCQLGMVQAMHGPP
jgi:hypothetical protein